MMNANYRLENFRPWNPRRDNSQQPDWNTPSPCQYPSPTSICASPTPHAKTIVPTNQKDSQLANERHPLPARPPAEVCINGRLQIKGQSSRYEPGNLEPVLSTFPDLGPETLVLGDLLHLENLSGDGTCRKAITTAPDNLATDVDQCLGSELSDTHISDVPGVPSPSTVLRSPILAVNIPSDESIDPAILNGHLPQNYENMHREEPRPQILPSACQSSSLATDEPPENPQNDIPEQQTSCSQPPKTKRVSVVVDNRKDRHKTRRVQKPQKGFGRKNDSFLAIRAQFSALTMGDRIQFLSWLFEGAVSHCTRLPSNLNDMPSPRSPTEQDIRLSPVQKELGTSDEAHHTQNTAPSRKGLEWLEEEDLLLKRLRLEQNLPWSEVCRKFNQKFQGKSYSSIQVHWSTKIQKKQLILRDSQMNSA